MSVSGASRRWELYRVLSEPVRLRLLALASVEELAIGELAELTGEAQPKVSKHVAPLKRAALLTMRKQGTRALVRLADGVSQDPVVADALETGRALCSGDGSLGRIDEVVKARDAASREFFARPGRVESRRFPTELPAYLSGLSLLLPDRALAVDVGTGHGHLLDVLAPVYDRVVALDRAQAQLDLAQERLVARGYDNVELLCGEHDGPAVVARVGELGGASVVFASRVLHHAPLPALALASLSRLVRPGGAVVVLDYGAHQDERLRDHQADQWLGFEASEMVAFAQAAGLQHLELRAIPAIRCGEGPDGHLDWQVLLGRRPAED